MWGVFFIGSILNIYSSATFTDNDSSGLGAGDCDNGFLGGRSRINSSALAADVPAFDPQAVDDDTMDESQSSVAIENAAHVDSEVDSASCEASTVRLRDLAR